MLENRNKIVLSLLALVFAFAVGRYTASGPDITQKTETESKENKVVDKDAHVKTVIIETTNPSGVVQKTTTITADTTTVSQDKKATSIDSETVTTAKKPMINVSALSGIDFKTKLPVYGAAVSKEFLGPVSLGVFGLTNGTLAVSIGISF